MMLFKNGLFYAMTAFALGCAIYQGQVIMGHKRYLEEQHPECMVTNPNFYPLFLFTIVFLCVVNLVVQALARAYFSNVLSLT